MSAPVVVTNRDIADVCVVGAGLAGALVAHALGRQGRSVVVLEAGQRFPRGTRHAALAQLLRTGESPWAGPANRDRFTNAGETPYPLNDYRVKGVGGTTMHWTAYTPRLHEHDFALRTRFGIADGAIAAGEAAIGLAILLALFRNKQSINMDDYTLMKG